MTPQIKQTYELFVKYCRVAGAGIPVNSKLQGETLLVRKLDCAVINFLHQTRAENQEPSFDTVYGVFEEGGTLFPASALKEKTHIQIAVRNINMIRGYFRPQELCNYSK